MPDILDPRLRTSRHLVFNLSRPDRSLMLLAPLAAEAGGWNLCRPPEAPADTPTDPVFASPSDPDYQSILAMISAGRDHLESDKRFDMPGFVPRSDWLREMQRYGLLPAHTLPRDITDVYAVEQAYWSSLWYQPPHELDP